MTTEAGPAPERGSLRPPVVTPATTFDDACRLVVDHLMAVAPMGMWAVTRLGDVDQIFLTALSPGYDLPTNLTLPATAGFCLQMVTGAAPQAAPDVNREPGYAAAAAAAPVQVQAYIGSPLVLPDGSTFGSVCGYDSRVHGDDLTTLTPLLAVLSSLLSAVLEADRRAVAVVRDLELSRREADTDQLTGLVNRRGWDRFLAFEEQHSRRFGDQASIVILDLDRLKEINDSQGHHAGDSHIRRAAGVIRSTARSGDLLARLGGDEFGIVAVGATIDQAAHLVSRLKAALTDAGIAGSVGHAPYTVVAGFPGAWEQADRAMYAHKHRHRSVG